MRDKNAPPGTAKNPIFEQEWQSLPWDGIVDGDIERHPTVNSGEPVLRNTRIPVELILVPLVEGRTPEEVADDLDIPLASVRRLAKQCPQSR